MIIYKGYPRAQGVTDFCDSAVMAGLMSVFEWPNFKMPDYFDAQGNPLRSGASDVKDDKCFDPATFSRDQLTCLIAGYAAYGLFGYSRKIYDKVVENDWRCPNGDLLSPSNRGHIKYCCEIRPSWLEDKWLYLDILFSSWVQPMAENNQLLCMLMIREPKWIKLYTKLNKHWRENILEYWSVGAGAWRAEPKLAGHMITMIERRIKA